MRLIFMANLAAILFFSASFGLEGKALLTIDNNFRGGNMILNDFKTGERMLIFEGHACGPSFSPDGQRISFIDVKGKKVMTCKLDGTDLKEVTACADYKELGVTYWLPDGNIYYNYHNNIVYKVPAEGGTPEEFFKSNKQIDQFGLSNDGKRIAWTQPSYRVMVRDIDTGEERTTGGDCQGTMSPDGKFFTRNHGGHKSFGIHSWDDMKEIKTFKCPGGAKHNLHRWSHFSQDFVIYTKEGKHAGVIHNIETDETTDAGTGTIFDYYDGTTVPTANVPLADRMLVRTSFTGGNLNVYVPSAEKALSEVFLPNGTRILNQVINGPGWQSMPLPFNAGIFFLRIQNAQGVTVKQLSSQ